MGDSHPGRDGSAEEGWRETVTWDGLAEEGWWETVTWDGLAEGGRVLPQLRRGDRRERESALPQLRDDGTSAEEGDS